MSKYVCNRIYIILCAAHSVVCLIPSLRSHDLNKATTTVVDTYGVNQILDIYFFKEHHELFSIDELLAQHNHRPYRIMCAQNLTGSFRRRFNVFIISNYSEFESMQDLLTPKQFNFEGYYILVLSRHFPQVERFCARVFEYFFNKYILNVIVLHHNVVNDQVDAYTFFPYSPHLCDGTEPEVFNYFRNGTPAHFNFFPDKVDNFYGCQLTAVFVESPPFIEFCEVNATRFPCSGADLLLIETLRLAFNFTLKVLEPDPSEINQSGRIFRNGTGTGALGMVLRGEANLSIGALTLTAKRLKFLTSSSVYFSANIRLVAPAPKPYGPIEMLFLPFDATTWIIVSAIVFTGIIIIFILRCLHNRWRFIVIGNINRAPVTSLFSILINGAVPRPPTRTFTRTVMILLILMPIVLRSAYQGSIFGLLRKGGRRKVSLDYHDYLKANYQTHVSPELSNLMNGINSSVFRNAIIYHENTLEYFHKLSEPDFKGLIFTNQVVYKYYHYITGFKYQDTLLDRIFFQDNNVMFFRKNSFLRPIFSHAISIYESIGMRVYYQRRYLPSRKPMPKIQNLPSIAPGWYYACGLLFFWSCVVFALEVVSQKNIALNRLMNYLNN